VFTAIFGKIEFSSLALRLNLKVVILLLPNAPSNTTLSFWKWCKTLKARVHRCWQTWICISFRSCFYRYCVLGLELLAGFLNHRSEDAVRMESSFPNVRRNSILGNYVLFCGKMISLIKKSHFLRLPVVRRQKQAMNQICLETFQVLIIMLQESNSPSAPTNKQK